MKRAFLLLFLYLCFPASAEVGFFSGAFDPVHLGHLETARIAGQKMGLKHVIMYPAIDPRDKQDATDFSARLELLRKAVAGDPYFIVPPEEIIREKLSTGGVEALLAWVQAEYGKEIVQVMGDDSFLRFSGSEKNAERFLKNPRKLIVFERSAAAVAVPDWIKPWVTVVHAHEMKSQGFSSTKYRADPIANRAMVPPAVAEEVERLGRYGCQKSYGEVRTP